MEELLGSSRARFKIVVGHMPIRNFGGHCSYRETAHECARLSFIEPILVKHKVKSHAGVAGNERADMIAKYQASLKNDNLTDTGVPSAGSDGNPFYNIACWHGKRKDQVHLNLPPLFPIYYTSQTLRML
eukprot:1160523-Pelagomonas_calceolata.AAC.3